MPLAGKKRILLVGSLEQLIIELDERFKRAVNNYGKQVKSSGRAMTVDIQGVKAEFYPSGWKEVSGKYGYSALEEFTLLMRPARVYCRTMDSEAKSHNVA